jgi:hypothetical protein
MNIDTLQTFISDNVHANVPDSVVGEMMKDAENMDFGSFVEKWDDTLKAKSAGWSDLRGDAKSLPERLTAAFGTSDAKNPFIQDANFKDELYEKSFKDVPKADYDATIDKMAKYWEDEKRARKYEAGKKLREREVKNWPWWKNILASDYAKQRYINEPDKSLFNGDNTLDLGLFKLTKWGESPLKNVEGTLLNKGDDISDFSYGVAGAAGDVLPGYGLLVGPAVRAGRDIQHKATDSPYQKDWSDIAQDVATDAVVNASVDFLPNLRRYTSMAKRGAAESPISTVMNLEDDVKNIREQVDFIDNLFTGDNYVELKRQIDKLPTSEFKTDLQKFVADPRHIDEDGIASTIEKWRNATNYMLDADQRKVIDYARQDIDKKAKLIGADDVFENPLTQRMIFAPELTDKQKIAKTIVRGVETAAKKGGPAIKLGDTAKGRGSQPEVDTKLAKDWYKQNYERDWKMGFKPNEKEGDLLWEAYKEWTEGK